MILQLSLMLHGVNYPYWHQPSSSFQGIGKSQALTPNTY
jgi:hypothetical protein